MNIQSITKGEYETIIVDIDGECTKCIRFRSDDAIYYLHEKSYKPLFLDAKLKLALETHRVKSEMGDLFNRIEDKIISYGWKYRSGISEVETCKYKFVYHHSNLPPIEIKRYSENRHNLIVTIGAIDFNLGSYDYSENDFFYIIVGYIVGELIRK